MEALMQELIHKLTIIAVMLGGCIAALLFITLALWGIKDELKNK